MKINAISLTERLILLISMMLYINVCAQKDIENTKTFVRVFDLKGKKICKGNMVSFSEASLKLHKGKKELNIPFSTIGKIKTKRSEGHNFLIGTAASATILGIAVAEDTNSDNAFFSVEGDILVSSIIGGIAGAAIGGITCLFKNSEAYEINGDLENWKTFKIMMRNNNRLTKN
jgi:hypothetical protein